MVFLVIFCTELIFTIPKITPKHFLLSLFELHKPISMDIVVEVRIGSISTTKLEAWSFKEEFGVAKGTRTSPEQWT